MNAVAPTSTVRPRSQSFAGPLPPMTAAQVAEILRFIPPRPAYPEWIRVIGAVGSALSEAEAIDVLSSWSPEERPGEYRDKLHSRLTSVTIGTLIRRAKQNGFDASAFTRRRAGRNTAGPTTPPQVPRSLAPVPPPPPKKLPRYSKRLGTAEELATLATLRRLQSPRRPRRHAGRRVPRLH